MKKDQNGQKLPKIKGKVWLLNNQLETYVFPCPDPQAAVVDALTINWNRWKFLYLFPPHQMILKAFQKLSSFKPRKSPFHNTRRNNETVGFSSKISSVSFIHNRGNTATAGRKPAGKRHKDLQT